MSGSPYHEDRLMYRMADIAGGLFVGFLLGWLACVAAGDAIQRGYYRLNNSPPNSAANK